MTVGATTRARAKSDMLDRMREVWPAVVQNVEKGATPIVAAGAAGVPSSTFLRWRAAMEAGDPEFVPFFERLETAIAKAEIDLLNEIRNPPVDGYGRTDTGRARMACFILERSRRERWGPKVDLAIETRRDAVRGLLDAVRGRMSPAAFGELLDALSALGDADQGEQLPSVITLPSTTGDTP